MQGSDVLQYVFGKTLGRRKIAPRVSPGKTWEGFIGGGAAAVPMGGGVWWPTPFSPAAALAMALAVVLAGFAGGLVLSAVNRSLGAKDWGQHGRGARRHARPNGQPRLRGADLLPPHALLPCRLKGVPGHEAGTRAQSASH